MADLTPAGVAAWDKRLRRAVDLATAEAEKVASGYLQRQAKPERKALTSFKPGQGGQAILTPLATSLVAIGEPLVKTQPLFVSRPIVESKPLIEKPAPQTRGQWQPSPGQMREAMRLALEAFYRVLNQQMR